MKRLVVFLAAAAACFYCFAGASFAGTVGNWEVLVKKSALDNSKQLIIGAQDTTKTAMLGVSCVPNDRTATTVVVIKLLDSHVERSDQDMLFSVDGGPVGKVTVKPSEDRKSVYIPNRREQFINNSLIDRKKIVMQLRKTYGAAKEMIFDIEGLREAISPHVGMCPELTLPPKP